jgi:hypothetical protein
MSGAAGGVREVQSVKFGVCKVSSARALGMHLLPGRFFEQMRQVNCSSTKGLPHTQRPCIAYMEVRVCCEHDQIPSDLKPVPHRRRALKRKGPLTWLLH